jgi:magnesium-transporting ATPase (P-type)
MSFDFRENRELVCAAAAVPAGFGVDAPHAPPVEEVLKTLHGRADGHHWKVVGEPTEGALRGPANKLGFERGEAKRLAVIPFDSQHKLMATLQHMPGARSRILMKGAPGPLLERCARQRAADGRDGPLDRAVWGGADRRT